MTIHAPSFKKFGTREDAGRALAKRLEKFSSAHDTVVLAIPKGGVPVGVEISRCLDLPFDVLLMSRITTPGSGKTPLGALTAGGVRVLNCAMIDRLHLTEEEVRGAVLRESILLARRERSYRCVWPAIEVADHNVILVDDGTSPCSMIRDAVHLLRRQHVERVVVAVPAPCHHSACDMRLEADEVVTLAEPSSEYPASRWFEDTAPLSTEDVCHILENLPMRQEAMN